MDEANNLPQQESPAPEENTVVETSSHPLKSFWVLLPLLFVLLGGFFYYSLAYFNQPQQQTQTNPTPSTTPFSQSGKIIIGTDATYPPMEFEDENGNYVGYDIDLGNRLAQELDVTAEFKNIAWDDLFLALEEGEVDVIISAVTITEERQMHYDFSDQYINAGQVIITQDTNSTITSTEDLADTRIGVQEGTTNEEQALLYTSEQNVILYDDFIEATAALVAGDVEVIFSDLTNAKSIIDENPSLKIASDPFTSEYYGVVIRKGETDTVAAINTAIESLRQKGTFVLLKQRWLE